MSTIQPQVEYVAHTRLGEKGQLTIPKLYRDELGLATGDPVAVLRIGEGLILIPDQNRFRILCESIASVFERRRLAVADVLDTLPSARQRVFSRRYPELSGPPRRRTRRSKSR
ncbi:MAG: AbrB/MazE/SpoVT family DNA-binding domain-containing protein [Acidobacteriia bacterium]|nr:AbrB/MazE/SpoVT family DNA-binding domain-containing protein [Terriglobia bacterium]